MIEPPIGNSDANLPSASVYEPAAQEIPGGPVPLHSPFYIERSNIEQEAFAELQQPGGLLRLKAPQKMGKSTLLVRLIDQALTWGYRPLYLDLQLADRAVLADADRFMRWFCATASRILALPSQVETYWSQGLNSKMSCLFYWQNYLLPQIDQPVVLLLNEVNRLFDYPVLAQEFLPFIRSLYEAARHTPILQKLRLVLAYSTEIYVPLQLNQSPFNVGLAIELPELTLSEIHTLVDRYRLPWPPEERMPRVIRLYDLVGGHPYLVQLALHHLAHECFQPLTLKLQEQTQDASPDQWLVDRAVQRTDAALTQLLDQAPTLAGIYRDHLQRHHAVLRVHPELATALQQVLVLGIAELPAAQSYKLQSLGLIRLQDQKAVISRRLYQLYFSRHRLQDPTI